MNTINKKMVKALLIILLFELLGIGINYIFGTTFVFFFMYIIFLITFLRNFYKRYYYNNINEISYVLLSGVWLSMIIHIYIFLKKLLIIYLTSNDILFLREGRASKILYWLSFYWLGVFLLFFVEMVIRKSKIKKKKTAERQKIKIKIMKQDDIMLFIILFTLCLLDVLLVFFTKESSYTTLWNLLIIVISLFLILIFHKKKLSAILFAYLSYYPIFILIREFQVFLEIFITPSSIEYHSIYLAPKIILSTFSYFAFIIYFYVANCLIEFIFQKEKLAYSDR